MDKYCKLLIDIEFPGGIKPAGSIVKYDQERDVDFSVCCGHGLWVHLWKGEEAIYHSCEMSIQVGWVAVFENGTKRLVVRTIALSHLSKQRRQQK